MSDVWHACGNCGGRFPCEASDERDETIADIPVIFVSAQDISEEPSRSGLLVATLGEGLSVSKLVRCSLELPDLLLRPDVEPVPTSQ